MAAGKPTTAEPPDPKVAAKESSKPGVTSVPKAGAAPGALHPAQVRKPTEAPAAVATPRSPRRPPPLPPILFEGDVPSAPVVSGPGGRFVTGPGANPIPSPSGVEELPESYATDRVWVTATDPRRLLVQWDFTEPQLRRFAAEVEAGRLILNVRSPSGAPGNGITVVLPTAARSWFVVLPHGGDFFAELGGYVALGRWRTLATSSVITLGTERPVEADAAAFATVPVDVPFSEIFAKVKAVAPISAPLIEVIQQLRAGGFSGLPEIGPASAPAWTPEQERALAEVLHVAPDRRVWVGSLDITELVRDVMQSTPLAPSSLSLAGAAEARSRLAAEAGKPGVSSLEAAGDAPRSRGFWFNVNAELIVYGATEPDARLTVAGRAVKLRPDGSFALRFALPDGEYELPVLAVAADGAEARSARLEFRRATEYRGADAHPQDPGLKPPAGPNVDRAALP